MSAITLYALDLVAAATLTFGIYWPRHRRRDLVVAFLGINVGVLAVSALLANSAVSAGIGLGLFGVLSIIRLRSDELAQHEIAYYFAFLALGLVGGLSVTPAWMGAVFMALIVLTMTLVDHPALLAAHRRQVVVVDRAIADEDELREHLSRMLGGRVTSLSVQRLDTVSDTTTVDVRYRLTGERPAGAAVPIEASAAERSTTSAGRTSMAAPVGAESDTRSDSRSDSRAYAGAGADSAADASRHVQGVAR
ncbi:DUF4956 domain-containing protein [Brachybacterium kimchii]|uniref:DUF4956 domain-containing protein n=1 Tax=Brachybacterium kimchii TaxID=2942909 RepID=A0ABY4N592_9MICO|nr:DUF4956 domain-containing protein [Brachybacterium kimchii]UQN28489.1 DUF4956 domain-containing protein [Brachybacterium kimchii]